MRISHPALKAATEARFTAAVGGATNFTRRGGDTDVGEGVFGLSLTWPAGVTANDFAIVVVSFYENDTEPTVGTPSGFTSAPTIVTISGSGSQESKVQIFTKACAGTETGELAVDVSNQPTANFNANATLDVYQADGDITLNSISAPDTGTATDATAPSVSATQGQGLVAAYGLSDPPGTTNSGPSGMTIGSDATTTTNSARTYYQEVASTGPTGTKTWDYTSSRSFAGYSILLDVA